MKTEKLFFVVLNSLLCSSLIVREHPKQILKYIGFPLKGRLDDSNHPPNQKASIESKHKKCDRCNCESRKQLPTPPRENLPNMYMRKIKKYGSHELWKTKSSQLTQKDNKMFVLLALLSKSLARDYASDKKNKTQSRRTRREVFIKNRKRYKFSPGKQSPSSDLFLHYENKANRITETTKSLKVFQSHVADYQDGIAISDIFSTNVRTGLSNPVVYNHRRFIDSRLGQRPRTILNFRKYYRKVAQSSHLVHNTVVKRSVFPRKSSLDDRYGKHTIGQVQRKKQKNDPKNILYQATSESDVIRTISKKNAESSFENNHEYKFSKEVDLTKIENRTDIPYNIFLDESDGPKKRSSKRDKIEFFYERDKINERKQRKKNNVYSSNATLHSPNPTNNELNEKPTSSSISYGPYKQMTMDTTQNTETYDTKKNEQGTNDQRHAETYNILKQSLLMRGKAKKKHNKHIVQVLRNNRKGNRNEPLLEPDFSTEPPAQKTTANDNLRMEYANDIFYRNFGLKPGLKSKNRGIDADPPKSEPDLSKSLNNPTFELSKSPDRVLSSQRKDHPDYIALGNQKVYLGPKLNSKLPKRMRKLGRNGLRKALENFLSQACYYSLDEFLVDIL